MTLTKTIKKRDNSIVEFKLEKVINAISKAGKETGEFDSEESEALAQDVLEALGKSNNEENELSVEYVQDIVEMVLLNSKYKATAKAYILYREKRSQERKPDIFKSRINLKPYEYPHLNEYKEAIQHSYWLHTEFNYTSDIHDYKVNISDKERNAIKNAMLAISQVEVAVKNFWGDLHNRMPKPEVGAVGATFSESEVRHSDAYSHLLEILGLNNEFDKIQDIPALSKRVNSLTSAVKYLKTESNKDFTLSLILFSLFIEHVSLFSQFLIIMSFNKYKNLFKGISNAIEATSKEEQLHGMFGIELVGIIRNENPEWFDEELSNKVYEACKNTFESEVSVVDWIYEDGDLDFLPKVVVIEFIKNRLNNSLKSTGFEPIFEINEELVDQTDWFTDELESTKHVDFFDKRSVNYTKRTKSIGADDLF
ncbi:MULTISPECIES: ribonucleotide-diphosphate reductase subunit beta [Lysinibacillus]|uniref:ribonucleotide-diphosphate reductase subunit beta n=1 Tax=Lysinibacillus TaxID=400634 RepID=UPI00214B433D|nr:MULTISPECIES: ribonucleotide-diphosphate reductase subunit beta [Lysinibacillus]UUV25992.1 ribonucleotide-diphosphate reductase subunit beta [Lysinibacillus sp. FN11]UYB48865.1 ribonucleotide-diphosphate reductase subunit beta [Lysinibacillus capsici]